MKNPCIITSQDVKLSEALFDVICGKKRLIDYVNDDIVYKFVQDNLVHPTGVM